MEKSFEDHAYPDELNDCDNVNNSDYEHTTSRDIDNAQSKRCEVTEASKVEDDVVAEDNIEFDLVSPLNDSALMLERYLSVIATDDEKPNGEDERNLHSRETLDDSNKAEKTRKKYKKPSCPCFVCGKLQSRFKRHLLSKHADHEVVIPMLKLNSKEQDRQIAILQRNGIRDYNMNILKSGKTSFMRERTAGGNQQPQSRKKDLSEDQEIPVMCSGCMGFFAR